LTLAEISGAIRSVDCTLACMEKRHVYVLRSLAYPSRHYVGLTSDLRGRLHTRNSGGSVHTSSGRPWVMTVAMTFEAAHVAAAFEQYLKTGSGRTFAKRHFRS
jgi:putative endonuclease